MTKLRRWQALLVAVLLSLATLYGVFLLRHVYHDRPLLIACIPAICISALLGGLLPGLVATAIAAFGGGYLFYGPFSSLSIREPRDLFHLVLLVVSGVLVSFLSGILHWAWRRLETEKTNLRESETRYRSLVAVAPVGVILQAADGTILMWNDMMREIFGLGEEDMVGSDARTKEWKTYRPDGSPWPGTEHPSVVTLETGKPLRNVVMRVVDPDGRERWISINTEPLAHEWEEKPYAVAITVADITERKREEQFREEVERIIRHDIKTPLISVFSMAQLIKSGTVTDELQSLIPHVEHSIEQAIRLIDSSGKLRKIELGEYAPRMEPFVVAELLGNVANMLSFLVHHRGVTILMRPVSRPQGGEGPCLGEPFLIEDMFMNLIKNAVEAAPRGGVVTVDHGLEKGDQVVRIHNQGEVPQGVRERFFEKGVTAGKIHGSGLGTYSAQLVARAHGGRIELDISREGATTVTVTLPCV